LIRNSAELRSINAMIVPAMPKKLIIHKFSKNKLFRRLYPAAKIIGGRMIVKKNSLWNFKLVSRA
jgi:hypothetical protein